MSIEEQQLLAQLNDPDVPRSTVGPACYSSAHAFGQLLLLPRCRLRLALGAIPDWPL
jgi:hypothetical protein